MMSFLAVLMQKGLEDCMYNIEKGIEDLRVKAALYQVKPLRAKNWQKGRSCS